MSLGSIRIVHSKLAVIPLSIVLYVGL
jgi:hypothetical protein